MDKFERLVELLIKSDTRTKKITESLLKQIEQEEQEEKIEKQKRRFSIHDKNSPPQY